MLGIEPATLQECTCVAWSLVTSSLYFSIYVQVLDRVFVNILSDNSFNLGYGIRDAA